MNSLFLKFYTRLCEFDLLKMCHFFLGNHCKEDMENENG